MLSEAVTDAVAAASRFVAAGGARALAAPAPVPSGSPPEPVSAEVLARRVRDEGGTVVVAGGCFDLLHAGHVSLLESARRLGDCLIVAINSDASVRRLKGQGRPVVAQSDRAALLAALACVDAVVVFDDDSPVGMLEQVRPDVFVKGGDYSSRPLPEAPVLAALGRPNRYRPVPVRSVDHRFAAAGLGDSHERGTAGRRCSSCGPSGWATSSPGCPPCERSPTPSPAITKSSPRPCCFAPILIGEGVADELADHHGLDPLDPALAGPDVAVDLHGRGPGSQPLLLALRPRRLIAFAHPDLPETAGGPRWRPGEQEVKRWCRLLTDSGIPADPRRLEIRPPAGPPPAVIVGATVIHPGAASPARRWPAERFAAIARGRDRPWPAGSGHRHDRRTAAGRGRRRTPAGLHPRACSLAPPTWLS